MIATCLSALVLLLVGGPHDPNATSNEAVAYQGVVMDASNAESLAGATVKIEELGITVITDFDGHFEFAQVPPGTYTLSVSLVSYANEAESRVLIDQTHLRKQILLDSL